MGLGGGGGLASISVVIISLSTDEKASTCLSMSIAHTSTVLIIIHRESPFFIFFTDMGLRRKVSDVIFGKNIPFMAQKGVL